MMAALGVLAVCSSFAVGVAAGPVKGIVFFEICTVAFTVLLVVAMSLGSRSK